MAAAYFVTLPKTSTGLTLANGIDSIVVYANNSADAIACAKAAAGQDSNAEWAGATATPIVAASDLTGFIFTCKLTSPAGVVVKNATYTGVASDTFDLVGTALATALGGNSSYNATGNILTVSTTGDAKGDHSIEFHAYLPASQGVDPVDIPGLIGTITHNGSASAATTVVISSDGYVLPNIFGKCTQR